MKHVLITGGPTNEAIDEVMKITNMSTGSLSLDLAARALKEGDRVTLIINNSVLGSARFARYGMDKDNPNLKVVPVESTQDMYEALEANSGLDVDVVIHASAVGDYKPQFTFRMEDMAKELVETLRALQDKEASLKTDYTDSDYEKAFLEVLADPNCKVKDDSKISSYEPNLTVKLTLTTKLISHLKEWYPNATLIGCKLLENVTNEHLIEVATKLCVKNNMDYIMANDLKELREGHPYRYLVTKDGFTGIRLNGEGDPALLDYAAENWFK